MSTQARTQTSRDTGAVPAPMLQRTCRCGAATAVSEQCPACAARERLNVQSRLRISRPGDRFEREADRIADQVVSGRPPTNPLRLTPSLQPQASDEAQQEKIQAKGTATAVGQVNSAFARGLAAESRGGTPLGAAARSFYQAHLGRDLSAVRIHTSARAADLNRRIDARAFTHGQGIYFAAGEYNPGATAGRWLMAHELAHTLQQSKGTLPHLIARSPRGPGGRQSAVVNPAFMTLLGVIMEMCRRRDTAEIMQRIDADNIEVRFFRRATDRWRNADGSEEDNDLSTSLRGNLQVDPATGRGTIRINERLSARDMVQTLFHEVQHWIHRQNPAGPRGLESEIQARIATEQLAIDRGWPETRPGYRTADGRSVNEAHIRQKIQSSSHYNPTGRTRIDRSYGGETVLPGPWACPPIGDFPTPTGIENIA